SNGSDEAGSPPWEGDENFNVPPAHEVDWATKLERDFPRAAATENPSPSPPSQPPPQPSPQTPPPQDKKPSDGNGRDNAGFEQVEYPDDEDDDDDASTSGGYPHGEHEIGRIEDTYIYRTMKGALHMRVIKRVTRRGKKSYPQYHLEDGKWVKGKPEGPALPYRLPELLAAPANATVEICEGEKDAKTLAFLGLISTTNPGGAGKWTSELNKWFTGFARANVYEDNDKPGHKHAVEVATALCAIIPDVRIVKFRELPEKGDVSDWLKNHTLTELRARADAS